MYVTSLEAMQEGGFDRAPDEAPTAESTVDSARFSRKLRIALRLGDRGRGLEGRLRGSALGEEPLDVALTVAPVTARVDAERRKTPGIGPAANRVRMHPEQCRGLGHGDQRVVDGSLAWDVGQRLPSLRGS